MISGLRTMGNKTERFKGTIMDSKEEEKIPESVINLANNCSRYKKRGDLYEEGM